MSGCGQSELGLNPLIDPASHSEQGEAVGAWLRVWHLWVDAHPQKAQRLGCLPPVCASLNPTTTSRVFPLLGLKASLTSFITSFFGYSGSDIANKFFFKKIRDMKFDESL